MVRLATHCCGGVLSSMSEREEEREGEEREKSAMNFLARVDLGLLLLGLCGVSGGAACSAHSVDGVGPNRSA